MRFGINLRGDLAKLDDAEIGSKFEALMSERDAMYQALPADFGNKWMYQRGWGMPFGRGLLHARIFYQLLAGLFGHFLPRPSLGDLYLLDCELKDVRDEMRRRIRRRPKGTAAGVTP